MMWTFILFIFFSALYTAIKGNDNSRNITRTYLPNWEDLRKRPLPRWYDAAKIGILVHWGVYSVPSTIGYTGGAEWFWNVWRQQGNQELDQYVKKNYGPGFKYIDFAPMFTAEHFDPEQLAKLFAEAGAKYVVLTSKHHDGFTLFPTNRRSWNSVDIGPRKDIVGALSKSVREYGMKFGVYYSLFEWFNPLYLEDIETNGSTTFYLDNIVWPDIEFLINTYKPSVLWSNGGWQMGDSYWRTPELLAWLYNASPVKDEIVVNDRWSNQSFGTNGDFFNYDDRFNSRSLMPHKWENCFHIDKKSWGYRRTMESKDIMTVAEVLEEIISTVSCGGNALINVGPTKDGVIVQEFKFVLLSLGKWLNTNGEAIYDTSPWFKQRDSFNSNVWYTCKKTKYHPLHPTMTPAFSDKITAIYIIFLSWPDNNILEISDLAYHLIEAEFHIYMIQPLQKNKNTCYGGNSSNTDGTALINDKNCLISVKYRISNDIIEINLPMRIWKHAWVLKVLFSDVDKDRLKSKKTQK